MKISLKKVSDIMIVPNDKDSADFIDKLKYNQVIVADFKKSRNYNFHKKYFALIKFAYEHWTPSQFEKSKFEGVIPEKSFERFRKDIIILSGRFDAVYRVDGSVRIEAKSISFASMNEESFAELYSATIDVILKKILVNYTEKELDDVVNEIMGYL
jgi:hypothetical protein